MLQRFYQPMPCALARSKLSMPLLRTIMARDHEAALPEAMQRTKEQYARLTEVGGALPVR